MSKISNIANRIIVLIILIFCSGCEKESTNDLESSQPITLTVLAAASLTEAFNELGQQFESLHPGTHVDFNFASSQQLVQQLENGAPADVFASADQHQIEVAIAAKRVDKAAVRLFAQNRLAVIYSRKNDYKVRSLVDLARPGLKLVLASKEVPVGKYSLIFLANASKDPAFGSSFQLAVLNNIVSYEQNVKGVLAKVTLGEADAGIVYTSDAFGSDAQQVGQIAIPDSLNVIAQYPIAPITNSHYPMQSQEFIAFVLSLAGQQTLVRYGFIPAKKVESGK